MGRDALWWIDFMTPYDYSKVTQSCNLQLYLEYFLVMMWFCPPHSLMHDRFPKERPDLVSFATLCCHFYFILVLLQGKGKDFLFLFEGVEQDLESAHTF